ncbi:carcinine transporter [Acyrthosiphon pisum]|uniref:Major facilitator superfamily (MFS) profile domain-containing protein n=1 Tax=Acyrthosiphon pisum TaxID=7029 RepID=A0A8R1WXL9_ACYPI|nr:carcinine transporter [Acyrthosiphon pisum]|eukprot:XP_008178363.1 PREDICTED: organic cation transporter protein [Acyrthosiphon pisum]
MDNSDSEKKKKINEVDLDEVLPIIGEFGRYQKLLLWLVCLPACIPCGFGAFNQLFMSDVPPHWCSEPQLYNFTAEQRKRIYEQSNVTQVKNGCMRYAVNWTEVLVSSEVHENLEQLVNESWPLEKCNSWEYDTSFVKSSIVIDFDLVCEHDIYPTVGLAALNLGGPIGVYFFGVLNDRIGRRKSYFLCLATLIVGSLLTACAMNFWWWAMSRVIVGLTIPAVYQIPFIISLELVGPNYRSFITVMTCMFYTLGLVLLSGVTYYVRNWVYLALATSTPFTLYFIYWWFLPESPRWLLAKGRIEEALKILETLARINGTVLPDSFKQKLKQKMMMERTLSEEKRLKEGPGVLALCRTPNMRLKTILITFNWFANDMVYIGLSYYGPSLGQNQYLSFLLSSVVEVPSCLVCWLLMDRWGRRWPLCLAMTLSGISCIVTVTLPPDAVITTLVLFLFSKFTISASFLIIYPFAGELYPTQLRGIGIGTSAYIAGLGLVLIPFINYLGRENLVLPLFIMGILSVIGGITGLRLPETLHYKLPQSVEEGEEFGKNWTMADCITCVPKRPSEHSNSYEDLTEKLEMSPTTETTAFATGSAGGRSKFTRQQSTMETPLDSSGVVKMTCWF